MNIEQLQLVNRNDTTDLLLHLFSTMKQVSFDTNLDSFYHFLVKKGNKVNKNQYDSFFKELADIRIDSVPVGFIAPNGIFKWNYSFKDVSEQILLPNKMVNIRPTNEPIKEIEMAEVKKSRGRPKGSRNKSTEKSSPRLVERPKVLTNGSPNNGSQTVTNGPGREVLFMFTTSKGKVVPFYLEDAEKLIQQVADIKQQLG